jgi:hypothetical protein
MVEPEPKHCCIPENTKHFLPESCVALSRVVASTKLVADFRSPPGNTSTHPSPTQVQRAAIAARDAIQRRAGATSKLVVD